MKCDKGIIGFYLGRTTRTMQNVLRKAFADAGYNHTPEQWHILNQLAFIDVISQQELSDALMKEKATITRLITCMEKKGLLVRMQSKEDKRSNLVVITEEGRKIQKALFEIIISVQNRSVSNFSEAEKNELIRLLDKIVGNLTENKL